MKLLLSSIAMTVLAALEINARKCSENGKLCISREFCDNISVYSYSSKAAGNYLSNLLQ